MIPSIEYISSKIENIVEDIWIKIYDIYDTTSNYISERIYGTEEYSVIETEQEKYRFKYLIN